MTRTRRCARLALLFLCVSTPARASSSRSVPIVALVATPQLAAAATSCPTAVEWRAPDPTSRSRTTSEAAAALAAARRAFNLLDTEGAMQALRPAVDALRRIGDAGSLHRDAEHLLARIAAFSGDARLLADAALHLAMLTPVSAAVDPAVRPHWQRARTELWRSGLRIVRIEPPPQRVRAHGIWQSYAEGVSIPGLADVNFPLDLEYDGFRVSIPVTRGAVIAPLASPEVIARLRGSAPLIWTADLSGPLLLSAAGTYVWRPGDDAHILCSRLADLAPATPRQRHRRIALSLVGGAAAVSTALTLGILRPWKATRGELIIQW